MVRTLYSTGAHVSEPLLTAGAGGVAHENLHVQQGCAYTRANSRDLRVQQLQAFAVTLQSEQPSISTP